MKLYGYKLSKQNSHLAFGTKASPKTLGYNYQCTKCGCPLFDDEKLCPDCGEDKRKRL